MRLFADRLCTTYQPDYCGTECGKPLDGSMAKRVMRCYHSKTVKYGGIFDIVECTVTTFNETYFANSMVNFKFLYEIRTYNKCHCE